MGFQIDEKNRIFGEMGVENLFIEEYMPRANGTFVKIYLMGLYLAGSQDAESVDDSLLAELLQITTTDVKEAWNYWENAGLIKREKDGDSGDITFLSIRNRIFGKEEKCDEKHVLTNKDVVEAIQLPAIADMFSKVDFIIRRETTPTEKKKILTWIMDYSLVPELVIEAFRYGMEIKGKRNLQYVEGILRNWSSEGVHNMEDFERHMRKQDIDYCRYQKVVGMIGLQNRPYNKSWAMVVRSWFTDLAFDETMVEIACKKSANIRNVNINYINSILEDWHKKGIRTPVDIEALDSTVSSSNAVRRTGFSNFDQRSGSMTDEELKELERISREKLLGGGDIGER